MPDLAGLVSIVAREIVYEVASVVFFKIKFLWAQKETRSRGVEMASAQTRAAKPEKLGEVERGS